MQADTLKYKGIITLDLFREGALIDHRQVDNVFLNVGKSWAIQRLFDDTTAVVSGTAAMQFYVGNSTSGNNAGATATDTTGQTTEQARVAFVYASGAIGAMSGTATFITSTANFNITEAGIFAGGTTTGDGVFVARAQFTAIGKTAADTLQVKWDVSIA